MNLLLLLALVGAAQSPDIKVRAEAIVAIDRNQQNAGESTAAIISAFGLIEHRELSPSLLATYDTRSLEVLFEAVSVASDRMKRTELLQALEDIFEECRRRGFVGDMISTLHARYIQARDLPKARRLYEQFPSTARQLPTIVGTAPGPEGGPTVYTVSEDGRTLTYKKIDLTGPIIISVVSPGCHFSNDLVAVIEADPKLASLFREHSVNIEPAPYSLDAQGLAGVNREGTFRYDILYLASGWKGFEFSGTPQFYFVKGGEVIYKIAGVKQQDFRARLVEGLAKVGL